MDFQQPYPTPDLAAVLQTLAAYAPPKPPPPPPPPPPTQQQAKDDLEEGEYDPSDFIPILPPPTPSQVPPLQPSHPNPLPPSNPPPSLTEKASLITSYPPALRHTTTLLTTHPTLPPRLRHLIHTAHTHERTWFTARETLRKTLTSRSESRRKIDTVLASITGETHASAETETDADVEEELRVYDRKVLKAYREMSKATGRDLGRMGIPFFCLREELVGVGNGKVGEAELEGLKARMVGFLEDMVRE
ncbi:MAG: hypothetical protein Q9182_006653 [Xanthomendoza sp. 2 TL-2023]